MAFRCEEPRFESEMPDNGTIANKQTHAQRGAVLSIESDGASSGDVAESGLSRFPAKEV